MQRGFFSNSNDKRTQENRDNNEAPSLYGKSHNLQDDISSADIDMPPFEYSNDGDVEIDSNEYSRKKDTVLPSPTTSDVTNQTPSTSTPAHSYDCLELFYKHTGLSADMPITKLPDSMKPVGLAVTSYGTIGQFMSQLKSISEMFHMDIFDPFEFLDVPTPSLSTALTSEPPESKSSPPTTPSPTTPAQPFGASAPEFAFPTSPGTAAAPLCSTPTPPTLFTLPASGTPAQSAPSDSTQEAVKTKQKIEKIKNRLARAHKYNTLGCQVYEEGQYDKALRYFAKAIKRAKGALGPIPAEFYSNRGAANFRLANYGLTVEDQNRALTNDGENAWAYYWRGCSYLWMKKFKKAREDLEMALYHAPKHRFPTQILERIEISMQKIGGALLQDKHSKTPASAHLPPAEPRNPQKLPSTAAPPHIPMPWSPSLSLRVPKLIDLAARSVAQEASNFITEYLESFRSIPADIFKQIVVYMDWPTLESFRRSPSYRDHVNSSLMYAAKKVEEDHYRTLFATSRSHPAIQDPYLTLIDVHKYLDLFNYEQHDAYEASIPKLLKSSRHSEGLSVVNYQEFIANFNVFTHNQLRCLDWDGVFVAGGAVLAALMTGPKVGLWEHFHTGSFRGSDIDLFVFGKTVAQANMKLLEVFERVQNQNTSIKYTVFRTSNVITLVSCFPRRHIQIILRLYKSPAEILMGFDVDSCCVGFNGFKVFAHPRCARALKLQFNMVDMSRRSKSYEYRLLKYSRRGFAVAVPGLDKSRIDPDLLTRRYYSGLGRLLYWEYEMRLVRAGFKPQHVRNPSLFAPTPKDRFNVEKLTTLKLEVPPSDYSSISIPYGPKWELEKCVHHVKEINRKVNSERFRLDLSQPPRPEVTLCVMGSMEQVLDDRAMVTVFLKDSPEDPFHIINKDTMWLTSNPGQQLTSSFQPINTPDEEWFQDGYKRE